MGGFGAGAFGGDAFGGEGGDSGTDIYETLSLATVFSAEQIELLAETLNVATGTSIFSTMVVNEALGLTSTVTPLASLAAAINDALRLSDPMVLVNYASINEPLVLTAVAGGSYSTLVALVDTLVMTGGAVGLVSALSTIVDAMALQAAAVSMQIGDVNDPLALADTLTTQVAYFQALTANLAFTDTSVGLAIFTLAVNDSFVLADTVTPLAHLIAAINDELDFAVSFNFGDTPYVAYSMNAATKALTRYSNFNFDALATFQGQTYATGAGGLYKLGGTTDDGDGINWRIRTGLTNFSTGKNKGMDAAYLGYTATGRVVLKCIVIEPGTGRKIAYLYELTTPVTGATGPGRILTGRGLRSVYWGFELTSLDAGSIDLDTLELHPVMFEGRLP